MDKSKKLSDVKRRQPVFGARLATEDFDAGGGVTLKLKALSMVLWTYVFNSHMADRGSGALVLDQVRFGVVDVVGLCDGNGLAVKPEFDDVIILGQKYRAISLTWLEQVHGLPLGTVSDRVTRLTELGIEDEQCQDFTGELTSAASGAQEEKPAGA